MLFFLVKTPRATKIKKKTIMELQPTTVVGIVLPEASMDEARRMAAIQNCSYEQIFFDLVSEKLSQYGGVTGIRASYANGRPFKLVVIKQNTDTSMCHVVLK